jgi:hypothetical protein
MMTNSTSRRDHFVDPVCPQLISRHLLPCTAAHGRRSYEEEDTCMSCEEEDTCMYRGTRQEV